MKRSTKAIRRITACAVLCAALALPPIAQAAIQPLTTYGTGVSGDAAGQLSNPQGVAVDGAGNVFVADTGNNRVSQYATNGAFVRAWGFDVIPGGSTGFETCTATTGCKDGSGGDAAGDLSNPADIAFDGGSNLYVIDEGNARISQFTTAGAFVRAFGWGVDTGASAFEVCTVASTCQEGSSGDGAGQLDGAEAIASNGTNVWVAEAVNARVSKFTSTGGFVHAMGFGVDDGTAAFQTCTIASTCQAGTSGNAAGQFSVPLGVAASSGALYVSDQNGRVNEFTTATTPAFVRAWGFGVDTGAAIFETCTAVSTCQAGVTGAAAGQLTSDARGLGLDGAGNLYIAHEGADRVDQFSTSPAFVRAFGWGVDTGGSGFEICTAASTCQAGLPAATGAAFQQIHGVAADAAGNVYVADGDGHRVQRFGEPTAAGPAGATVSNAFNFGKLKLNKHTGTATLTVEVPGPGTVDLSGKGLKPLRAARVATASKAVAAAGKVTLTIKAKGKKRKKLNQTGKVKVTAKITYTPIGGAPNTQSKSIRLKKNLD